MGITPSIVIFILLLLTDMYFYGFGAAVTALNYKEIQKKADEVGDKKSFRLLKIIGEPAEYVNTVQLIVTIINITVGAFYVSFWQSHVEKGVIQLMNENKIEITEKLVFIHNISFAFIVIFLIYILLTFGVLLPKKIAARIPEKWAYHCINPIYLMTKILYPFTGIVSVSVKAILRIFGIKTNQDYSKVTEEEIISMVNEGHEKGVIEASEVEMITNIFEMGDTQAQDIMTHRSNMVSIDGDATLKEAMKIMLNGKYSRYPVYEENIDHVIGVLHLKDAVRIYENNKLLNKPIKDLKKYLREAVFIPQTRKIDDLFKDMQSKKLQMVIVVDEYGQTAGVVAMEDILEEIVGNIMDEYDEDNRHIEQTSQDEYIIEGFTPLEELEERFQIQFCDQNFETLNGFLISKLDHIPEKNEQFEINVDGYNFKILSVDQNVIKRVRVTKCIEEISPDLDSVSIDEGILEEK